MIQFVEPSEQRGARRADFAIGAALVLLAAFIWFRDLGWLDQGTDTWLILVGIPIFIGLLRPWDCSFKTSARFPAWSVGLGGVLFLSGVIAGISFLLALSWTLFLWSWLTARLRRPSGTTSLARLSVLPFCAFPWIATDFNGLGWGFRLSGAAAAEQFFSLFPFEVERQGTFLWVNGHSISVDAACSGMNGLQSILIAGAALACLKLGRTSSFWWNLPLLFVVAWLANVIRIVVLSSVKIDGGLDMSDPFLHGLAGWGALCAAFGLCWGLFSLQESKGKLEWERPLERSNG